MMKMSGSALLGRCDKEKTLKSWVMRTILSASCIQEAHGLSCVENFCKSFKYNELCGFLALHP